MFFNKLRNNNVYKNMYKTKEKDNTELFSMNLDLADY